MGIEVVRTKVEQLLNAVARAAASTGTPLQRLRGVALFDSSKDRLVTSLAEFEDAQRALGSWDLVRERLGEIESHRLALQLVDGYFARTSTIEVNPSVFASLWADLVAELESPVWLTRAVTNLRHFQCDAFPVELGDGLSIQGRSPEMLIQLGFHPEIWSRLEADWSGSGASSFVLLAETTSLKVPDNSISPDGPGVWLRCMRAIGALRLIAPGDIGLSTTFFQRIARFNVGIGGMHATGSTKLAFGRPYTWIPEHKGSYDSVYAALAKLESTGYGRGPGNLDLALRAFMSSYDRVRMTNDERLVDAITALEAILGTESEIGRSSFHFAWPRFWRLPMMNAEPCSRL